MAQPPPPPPIRRRSILDGKYELIAPVGQGGMASMWRGEAIGAAGFRRPVAVKRILPRLKDDQQYVQMFVEEARVGSELVHPNLVQVYDFCGSPEQGYFMILEWVEGVGLDVLADSYQPEPADWTDMTFLVACALTGLSIAHERVDDLGQPSPIIHRDVSPANILVSVRGEAKLGDFGLAKASDRRMAPTAPGILKGKPSYTAPELLTNADPGVPTDIYATGVVLWELLAARKLFDAPTTLELFQAIMLGDVPRLSEVRSGLPPALVDLVAQALATDPAARPASASLFAMQLLQIVNEEPVDDLRVRIATRVRALVGSA